MNYKHIERAICYAIDEVRNERYDANERLETDMKIFEMLDNVQRNLMKALEELQ